MGPMPPVPYNANQKGPIHPLTAKMPLLMGLAIFAILANPCRAAAEQPSSKPPATSGPLISDTCVPIEEHRASLQVLAALSIYTANFTQSWRSVSTKGDLLTLNMPVKFSYGPAKNLEAFIVVPFIVNWINNVDKSQVGPNGERSASFAGIGDITTVAKYLVLEEGKIRPAIAVVGGVTWPNGHASHLNPRFLLQAGSADAVGTGAFTFTTGVNMFKWIKPFLVYSNIWLNSPVNLFKLTAKNSKSPPVRSMESVTCNLAAEYPLRERWILLLEMYSTWTWNTLLTPTGFQSPSTILGFLPGVEYRYAEKWTVSAGCAFDTIGKSPSSRTIVPMLAVSHNF
jgi:hypothetical protein